MEKINLKQSFYRRRLENYAIVFNGIIAFLFVLSAFATEYYYVRNAGFFEFWYGGRSLANGFMGEIFLSVFILPVIALVCRIILPKRKILLNFLEGIVLFLGIMMTLVMQEGIGDDERGFAGCFLGETITEFMNAFIAGIAGSDALSRPYNCVIEKTHFGVSPFLVFGATGLAVIFTLVKLKKWWIRKRANLLIQKRKNTAAEFSAE